MANIKKFNITRQTALDAALALLHTMPEDTIINDVTITDVMDVVEHMGNQLRNTSKSSKPKGKTVERKENEANAIKIVDIFKADSEVKAIGTGYVRDNLNEGISPQKASIILRTACNMGLLKTVQSFNKDGSVAKSGPKRYALAD